MAGADQMLCDIQSQDRHEESQTQPETQFVPDSQEESRPGDLKRKPAEVPSDEHASKKVKVSIGPAVDLGD